MNKNMSKEEFFQYAADHVKEYLPPSYDTAKCEKENIIRNNDQKLMGLTIRREDEIMSPRIYLDPFYENYLNGSNLDSLVADIADIRIENEEEFIQNDFVETLMKYEDVKDHLQIRLCDKETNKERLDTIVHTDQGDFAATYHVKVSLRREDDANVVVTPQLLQSWGIGVDQLHQDAMTADRKQIPKLFNLMNLISNTMLGVEEHNILDNGLEKANSSMPPMYCLTNDNRSDAAALILQEDLMKQIGDIFGMNYFVLPSSVHEHMICPDNGAFSLKELSSMVKEINETNVAPEERLSDKVQYYDKELGVLENAEKRQNRLSLAQDKGSIHQKLSKTKETSKNQVRKEPEGRNDPQIAL